MQLQQLPISSTCCSKFCSWLVPHQSSKHLFSLPLVHSGWFAVTCLAYSDSSHPNHNLCRQKETWSADTRNTITLRNLSPVLHCYWNKILNTVQQHSLIQDGSSPPASRGQLWKANKWWPCCWHSAPKKWTNKKKSLKVLSSQQLSPQWKLKL